MAPVKGICFAVLFAMSITMAGCSVKEDREPCPCWLLEDLSECYGSDSPLYLSAWKGTKIYLEAIDARMFPAGFEKKVPRQVIEVSAFRGMDSSFLDGHDMMIPAGYEADSIYAHKCVVDATGEYAYDKVVLHKQFATIVMDMDGYDKEGSLRLEVSGNACGMDILELSPIEGSFLCTPRFIKEGRCAFRVPRQHDDSLTLKVTGERGETKLFHIGEMIAMTDYSWNSEDLDDIYIDIDYHKCSASITVMNWEDGMKDIFNY